ncbi:hypothetical protein [Escherichia coli]|uniref:hypothetical protein n=1 Tax=Escherichia coli TaxID=562 RepID=UPI002021FEB0|nr:hypothetical protein [Escherichia coli]
MTQAKANLRKLRRARYVPPRTVKKSIANTERVVSKAITGCGVFRDIPQVKNQSHRNKENFTNRTGFIHC